MKLIVGLGNPGQRYARNRHNAGFMVIDLLASDAGCGNWLVECGAAFCHQGFAGRQVILAKPLTYMNRCGGAVLELVREYRIATPDVLLILDDFNLPFGRIRIRERGSSGGHNGLESVLAALESEEVPRIRLGIGEENMPSDKAEFVLADFPPERAAELNEMIARAADAVRVILLEGVPKALAVFNA